MQSNSTTPKRKFEDYTGRTFGNITVQRFSHITKLFVRFWECVCICGRQRILAEHLFKDVSFGKACKKCRSLRTIAKHEAIRAAKYVSSNFYHIAELLDGFVLDRSRPWDSYPCLDWDRCTSTCGYGVAAHEGKQYRVTRIVFERFNQPLQPHEHVLHYCNRPICISPAHIRDGSPKDNVGDCVRAKRHCHGERHGMALLNDTKVVEIRKLHAEGFSQSEIARQFGVHLSTIHLIIKGKHWKHV